MEIGLAIVCVSGIVALTTMVLKYVPGKDGKSDLNDRVVTLEARVKYHAESLDKMDDTFREINRKLDEINKNLPRKN